MISPGRAVAFDFNGTLSDDEEVLFDVFAGLFAEYLGWRMERRDYFGRLAGLSDREIVRTAVREQLPKNGDPDVLAAELLTLRGRRYREHVERHPPVRTATTELVRALHERGTALAIVTGAQRADVAPVVERAGVADCFTTVIAAEDVAEGKPAPEGYLRAAGALGVNARDVVAVEDSVAGVRAATAAGMRCVALTGTHDRSMLAAEGATVVDALGPALLARL